MTNTLLSRNTGRFLFAFACAATALPCARAQTTEAVPAPANHEAIRLDNYVVSATRTPQDPKNTPSSVSVLSPTALGLSQIMDLRTALAAEPGVIINNTGAAGGQSSVMMRGANSNQTLFVVDGVRMNDKSSGYENFLGQVDLGGIDRLEVLRGPQSTLYGSSAMGGVIMIDTTHGCGEETGALTAMAGSFNTVGGSASVQGGTKSLGYSGYIGRVVTDNDRTYNNNKMLSYATRVEVNPTASSLVGVTFRGLDGDYQEPGSKLYSSAGFVEAKNYLGTAYGQVRLGGDVTSRLTAGWHQREYVYTSQGAYSSTAQLRNTRNILDWQNTWTATRELEVVVGANYERSYFTVNGSQTDDTIKAGYLSATYRPIEAVTLTAGVRSDDYDSVGGATTWRSGMAWVPAKGTKLHGTYGTGFGAPGSDDRYGVAAFGQFPNPDLRPEKSRGWDLCIDQAIYGDALTASVTYFHNRFTDLFQWFTTDFITYQGKTVNVGRATTQGVELALTGKINNVFHARVAYTYLDATDDVAKIRLIRRPRQVVDVEVQFQVTDPWLIGAGVHGVVDRVDGFSIPPEHNEDYATVRVFTSYAVRKDLLLKLRVENLFDEQYSETPGYPALPRAVYGAVEWKF